MAFLFLAVGNNVNVEEGSVTKVRKKKVKKGDKDKKCSEMSKQTENTNRQEENK